MVRRTVELSRRSVARDLLLRKARDTRKRSALMSCSTSFSVLIFDSNTFGNPRLDLTNWYHELLTGIVFGLVVTFGITCLVNPIFILL